MPYPGVPSNKISKMDSCVADLMKQGKSKESAIRICRTSIMGADSLDFETAHQIIHDEAGSVSECPICNGSLAKEKAKDYALEIIRHHVKMRHQPEMPMPMMTAAEWTTAYINDLPDSSFAYIEPGGKKDETGKTTPRSLRHLPYKDKNGKIDLPHLRNALARAPQTNLPPEVKKRVIDKLRSIAKDAGIEVSAREIISFIDLIKAGENSEGLPTEIQVLPVGKWNTGQYGEVEVTEQDIKQMEENFKKNIRVGVPIDVDHDGKGAAGWVKDLIAKGKDGLWAVVEWTAVGKQLLKDKIYRFFSPEFSLNFIDPETSKYVGPVFVAGTLTNRPLFKELKPLTAKEDLTNHLTNSIVSMIILGSTDMNLEEIKAKDPASLTEEEKAFLKENIDSLTEDEKVKFGLVENPPAEDSQENKQEETNPEGGEKKEEENNQREGEVTTASEKDSITIKASEFEAIKKMAEEGRKASQELMRMKVEREVEGTLLFHEKGGKVAPKGKDALISLILSFTEQQKKWFDAVMEAIPDRKMFGEIGSGKVLTSAEEFNKLIASEKELALKEGKTLSDAEATKLVARKYPEVYKAYEEDLKK